MKSKAEGFDEKIFEVQPEKVRTVPIWCLSPQEDSIVVCHDAIIILRKGKPPLLCEPLGKRELTFEEATLATEERKEKEDV